MVRSAWCWVGLDDLSDLPDSGCLLAEKIMTFSQIPQAPGPLNDSWTGFEDYQPGGPPAVHRVVQKVWEELSGPKAVAERYGLSGVRNCRQFLELLFLAEKGLPEETLSHLEFRLPAAYAPPDPLASRSQVSIMTVHHAKGLEFDTVFVPHSRSGIPWRKREREDLPYIMERLPGEREEHLIALRPDRRTKQDPGVMDY